MANVVKRTLRKKETERRRLEDERTTVGVSERKSVRDDRKTRLCKTSTASRDGQHNVVIITSEFEHRTKRKLQIEAREAISRRTRSAFIYSLSFLLITCASCTRNVATQAYDSAREPNSSQQQDSVAPSQSESSSQTVTAAASSPQGNNNAACFGGLQTFEKISMSSFESPTVPSSSSAGGADGDAMLGGGILVQQDDQALTSECINLCRSQSNCLSFVIDYNKFECKSYATTQQELQQEFATKFQAGNATGRADSGEAPNGYQASASSMHFQQLLPSASSNYFEKICLDGVANRNQFSDVCGQGRLWTVERVVDSFLEGFVEKEVTNVNNKDECSKLCIFETQFVCRSADYDQHSRLCRLSKEDRRTQPQAMRYVAGSNRQHLENQCATPGPSSCVYETRKNVGLISMDALKFAQTPQDCQMKCNQEATFNCRSYSFHQQRCFLSGDDSVSLNSNSIKLPTKPGWTFGEKRCLVELCTKGLFSYEKITGFTLRSALSTSIDLMMQSSSLSGPSVAAPSLELMQQESSQPKHVRHLLSPVKGSSEQGAGSSLAAAMLTLMSAPGDLEPAGGHYRDPLQMSASSYSSGRHTRASNNLAITEHCRHSCDLGYLNCPAFTIDYKNNRCQRLDRNSQGRHHELVARDGFAYYEKICLRVPEIMSMCQDKYWIFERVIGYELAPRLYDKSLKFVQSRRDCEEYCLEERQFQCRSALYNDETSDCKLSRFNRRLALHEGAYYRNFNARISYLENNCVRDHQPDREQCFYEKAKDEPAYPTFTERIEMAAPPPVGPPPSLESRQNSSQVQRYGSSFCEQLCNDNSKFECNSFGYYASTAQCFLSGDDSISAGEMAATSSTGFTYYEKRCRLTPVMSTLTNSTTAQPNSSADPMGTTPAGPLMNPYFQPTLTHHQDRPSSTSAPHSETAMDTVAHNNGNNADSLRPYGAPPPTRHQAAPSNSSALEPDQYKCGVGHTFVYQRISGFEPIGGYLTLLIKNNEQPGIVAECSDLCKRAFECRAFVVDYNNNQCFAMLENSSVGLLSLRQTLGKDYFEGFCLADHLLLSGSNCRNKTWLVDKIVDQAVVGVQHQRLIQDSDRSACRQACLEERLFWCKSAMFDSSTSDCKLYSVERESMAQMRLLFTKGVDFFENQCQISSSSCPYDAIERDMTHVTITKSVQARSTFDCELACNSEVGFNCRSYTYLEQYPSLPNLCLLSSDSRSTSQRGSVREHQKTLYAERNCYYRRPRYPGGGTGSGHISTVPRYNTATGDYSPAPPSVPSPPAQTSLLGVNTLAPPVNSMGAYNSGLPPMNEPADKYEPMFPAVAPSPPRLATEQEASRGPFDASVGPPPALGLGGCEPHQYTFERTFGHDFKLAPKERASIAPTIGIAVGCQQECLRRGDKCQSFVVEYALPYQSCFLIETQAGANKRLLVKSPNSAYFEKVCLPRTGVQEQAEPLTHAPLTSPHYGEGHPEDIAPSYSQEPWSPQVANQLPYYLQQQQLVQNYPSRACPKLWSFERFVNHNFTAQADRVIEDSLTRAHCETQCLNEASFSCRALTYDYNSNLCRLFKNTRRTLQSHFIDLESGPQAPQPTSSTGAGLPNSHPGVAHVISNEQPSAMHSEIQTAASSLNSNSLGDPTKRQDGARQVAVSGGALATAEPSNPSKNIDYSENTCTPEPSSCQYRQIYDQFSPYIDKVNHAISLGDCQRQCDLERLFSCKSINYDPITRNCMLVNEDLISLDRGQQNYSLLPKKNTIYSEKGNCEMISVQCNSQEMLVSINFDSPFRGRVMAKGNPEQCYLLGDGRTNIQFPIVFGPKCNSRQEGHNTFVNEVVIQQHPVIMTESDKIVRVMCAFEAPDQTITLKNPSSRDNKTGIDVGTPETGRTRHDKQHFNSVVSNKAAPPSVVLRILDPRGRDASMINLGDDLVLRIQMQMDGVKNSALGIFARNLAARSSNGESLLLIDNEGCPVDPQVFPALEIDSKDGRSLQSTFKAFRFPSSGLVNFEVQIRFCPERCQPVECHKSPGPRMRSFGRRRKRRHIEIELGSAELEPRRSSIIQSTGDEYQQASASSSIPTQPPVASLDSLSTVMKPGKAFEFVRKLMLPPSTTEPTVQIAQGDSSTQASVREQAPAESPVTTDSSSGFQASPAEKSPIEDNGPPMNEEFDSHAPETPTRMPNEGTEVGPVDTTPPSLSAHKPIHADEKEVPSSDFTVTRNLGIHSGNIPPYGHFASTSLDTLITTTTEASEHQKQTATSSGLSVQPDNQMTIREQIASQLDRELEQSRTRTQETNAITIGMDRALPASAGGSSHPSSVAPTLSTNDMPLRFSIMVGENQPELNGRTNVDQPPVLIMNSTNMDLDHIVIPGKRGQLDDSDQISATNSLASTRISSAGYSDYTGNRSEPSKRNASYDQTFDALPSNSISSEVNMNHNQHHRHQNSLSSMGTIGKGAPFESAAASHDCSVEAGKSRMRTIIWAGGIVITLNVCLVILSLVMYFKRVHLRADHSIVRSADSDYGTQRSDGSRWPSVILKSKNKLGTSINAHEHFFCKLNSKPGGSANLEHDHNWPNLSSSSSRSTITSLASPIPSTSIRVNQMRPSLKSTPFDAHSSLRSGNFNTSALGLEHDRGEFDARYTNNIDILHSDRF